MVDATCGNGNDTLFLARIVGPSGTVYALDLQVRVAHLQMAQHKKCKLFSIQSVTVLQALSLHITGAYVKVRICRSATSARQKGKDPTFSPQGEVEMLVASQGDHCSSCQAN